MSPSARHLLAAAAMFFPAAPVFAQNERAFYTLGMVEVAAGTNTPVASPNGTIEPGEAARIELTISFIPAVGTIVTPPPPFTGPATVVGLASSIFHLLGGPGAEGEWTFRTHAPGWSGFWGNVGAGGAEVREAQNSQIGQPLNSSNPINAIWRGVWTPNTYQPRSVFWRTVDGSISGLDHTALLLAIGPTPTYIGKFIPADFGSFSVPIVPAPPSALAFLAAGAIAFRRRCRG